MKNIKYQNLSKQDNFPLLCLLVRMSFNILKKIAQTIFPTLKNGLKNNSDLVNSNLDKNVRFKSLR